MRLTPSIGKSARETGEDPRVYKVRGRGASTPGRTPGDLPLAPIPTTGALPRPGPRLWHQGIHRVLRALRPRSAPCSGRAPALLAPQVQGRVGAALTTHCRGGRPPRPHRLLVRLHCIPGSRARYRRRHRPRRQTRRQRLARLNRVLGPGSLSAPPPPSRLPTSTHSPSRPRPRPRPRLSPRRPPRPRCAPRRGDCGRRGRGVGVGRSGRGADTSGPPPRRGPVVLLRPLTGLTVVLHP